MSLLTSGGGPGGERPPKELQMSQMLSGMGDEQVDVSSVGTKALTVPHGAVRAEIKVTLADIYMTADKATASSGNGTLVRNESRIDLTANRHQLKDFRFIRAGGTDAKLYVTYFN